MEATPAVARWDATPGQPPAETPGRWDAGGATPAAGGSRWDATPGRPGGEAGDAAAAKRNRWDATPTPGRVSPRRPGPAVACREHACRAFCMLLRCAVQLGCAPCQRSTTALTCLLCAQPAGTNPPPLGAVCYLLTTALFYKSTQTQPPFLLPPPRLQLDAGPSETPAAGKRSRWDATPAVGATPMLGATPVLGAMGAFGATPFGGAGMETPTPGQLAGMGQVPMTPEAYQVGCCARCAGRALGMLCLFGHHTFEHPTACLCSNTHPLPFAPFPSNTL